MQAIIDYLLEILNNDDELPHIDVDDVFNFLHYLLDKEMDPAQMIDEIDLYEFELNRVAWEGRITSSLLQRLLLAPATPMKGYVVGL